ncbi:MAG: OmpA family protein [Pseudomonadota bacterium]
MHLLKSITPSIPKRFQQAIPFLTLLPFVALTGCATPDNVAQQTAPLADQLQTVNQRLDGGLSQALNLAQDASRQATAAQNLAREVDGKVAALDARVGTQARQLESLAGDLAALRASQSGELQRQVNEQVEQQVAQKTAEAEARALAAANARIQAANQSTNGRLDQIEKRLAEVARMAEDALAALGLGPRKIFGKVVHSTTLTDDKTMYPINSPDLGSKDMAKLDAVADYVKKLDVNYHIGIHGHTDGLGSDDYNYDLAKARAEVVKGYLHEQKGIPLLRMSVISHGATDVSAYRQGSNRRIVVEVLQ